MIYTRDEMVSIINKYLVDPYALLNDIPFDVWFKEKVDIIIDKNTKGLLQEAFKAGQNYSTFNGRPGHEDAPDFNKWYEQRNKEKL